MFCKADSGGYQWALKGIRRKTLAFGKRTLCTEFLLDKGSVLPPHCHPHEQTGYLVKGHVVITAAGEALDARPGDSWSIPGNVEHGAHALAASVVIDVFSPVRKDYLPTQPASDARPGSKRADTRSRSRATR
jgi:quercetin dioxygenase-like cupin family protein